MSCDNFWLSLQTFAEFLDGGRTDEEKTIDLLLLDLGKRDPKLRDRVATELLVVTAQLSRLKLRMPH